MSQAIAFVICTEEGPHGYRLYFAGFGASYGCDWTPCIRDAKRFIHREPANCMAHVVSHAKGFPVHAQWVYSEVFA